MSVWGKEGSKQQRLWEEAGLLQPREDEGLGEMSRLPETRTHDHLPPSGINP